MAMSNAIWNDQVSKNATKKGWLHSEALDLRSSWFSLHSCVYVVPTTLVRRFHFRIQHSQRSKNYVTVIQLSSNSRVLGTGALVKPVKTVYQDEFYRSLYRILGCSARISSEWSGNKRGRIDFRLPEANWGIEILIGFKNIVRDLINDGRLVDWLIIDCWTSMPRPYGTTLDLWAI